MSHETRNSKKLLYEALEQTGDRPEQVNCQYYLGRSASTGLSLPGGPSLEQTCTADHLPERDLATLTCYSERYEYDLIQSDEGPRVKVTNRYHERK